MLRFNADGLVSLGKLAIKVLPSDTFHAATPTPDDDILRVLGIIAGEALQSTWSCQITY